VAAACAQLTSLDLNCTSVTDEGVRAVAVTCAELALAHGEVEEL
jgi:hypothetical protein